jgi:hypothetical protein
VPSLAQPVGRAGFYRIFGPPGLRPLPLRRAAFLALAHVVFLALAHVVLLALAHVVFLALARLGLAPRKVRPQRCCKPLLFRFGPSMGHGLGLREEARQGKSGRRGEANLTDRRARRGG